MLPSPNTSNLSVQKVDTYRMYVASHMCASWLARHTDKHVTYVVVVFCLFICKHKAWKFVAAVSLVLLMVVVSPRLVRRK